MSARRIVVALIAALSASLCVAQNNSDCAIFLQKPVYTQTTVNLNVQSKENFRLMQCSAQWKSAQDAQNAGLDATVPIYDIPVTFSANWDQQKVETWKSKNCSDEERKSDYATAFYKSTYAIDPVSAKAGLACFQAMYLAQAAVALRCSLTQTGGAAVVFEASWRRTPGESDNPPVVQSFGTLFSQCLNPQVLGAGTKVSEGGVDVLCQFQGDGAPMFSLNTTRGACSASATPRLPKVTFPPKMVLANALVQTGTDMEIAANSVIVTNGYPIVLNADRLTIGSGSRIISFEAATPAPSQPGKYAGSISITARDVIGGGLSILNAGQPGGNGPQGPKGTPGPPGGPGAGRSPLFKQCGPLQFLCDAVLIGCTGGENGGAGGQGSQGFNGIPGAPGGGAGDVIIDVPLPGQKGFTVLADVDLAGQPQACSGAICGGKGGIGGPGGPGGDGGPGGQGASGTVWCGGTSAGPTGPAGPPGVKGPDGRDGAAGALRFL